MTDDECVGTRRYLQRGQSECTRGLCRQPADDVGVEPDVGGPDAGGEPDVEGDVIEVDTGNGGNAGGGNNGGCSVAATPTSACGGLAPRSRWLRDGPTTSTVVAGRDRPEFGST